MGDKPFTLPIQALGDVVGPLEPDGLTDLDLALRGWLELPEGSRQADLALLRADALGSAALGWPSP